MLNMEAICKNNLNFYLLLRCEYSWKTELKKNNKKKYHFESRRHFELLRKKIFHKS
jgi:hypothetical protein